MSGVSLRPAPQVPSLNPAPREEVCSLPAAPTAYSPSAPGKLCLLVSRRCNLRCNFCQVEFTNRDMTWDVARAGVWHYVESLRRGAPARIKFFGGEPLLNFPLIRDVVESVPRLWRDTPFQFEVATNGCLFDEEMLVFFRGHSEIDITVSQQPWPAASLSATWFTLVLTPDLDPVLLCRRMANLWKLGFRRFNFLPSYYADWSAEGLERLRRCFAGARRMLEGFVRLDASVRVKNLELFSPIPLYNDAVTLDVDGSIYASNIIQVQGTERYWQELRLGDIGRERGFLRTVPLPGGERLRQIISEWAGPEKWAATQNADRLLSEFVHGLDFLS